MKKFFKGLLGNRTYTEIVLVFSDLINELEDLINENIISIDDADKIITREQTRKDDLSVENAKARKTIARIKEIV